MIGHGHVACEVQECTGELSAHVCHVAPGARRGISMGPPLTAPTPACLELRAHVCHVDPRSTPVLPGVELSALVCHVDPQGRRGHQSGTCSDNAIPCMQGFLFLGALSPGSTQGKVGLRSVVAW